MQHVFIKCIYIVAPLEQHCPKVSHEDNSLPRFYADNLLTSYLLTPFPPVLHHMVDLRLLDAIET